MPVFNNILAGAAGQTAEAAAGPIKSLRFNSGDSAHLSKTFSSAGNRKKWTWSAWVKLCSTSTGRSRLFGACGANTGSPYNFATDIGFKDNKIVFTNSANDIYSTDAVFRDYSAWYHIVVALDTTDATTANRVKIYVNGVLQDKTHGGHGGAAEPSQDLEYAINSTDPHNLGATPDTSGTAFSFLDGYMADIYFIDGSALDPTSFGAFDDNGVWQAAAYSGTFGTNGFHLSFSDATSTTTIAEDSSGNNNDFTANNISVSAGSGNDSLFDVPTNGTQSDTGAGGEVSGNYATLNPLAATNTLSNGNLEATRSTDTQRAHSTIAVSSGKWYAECTTGQDSIAGISLASQAPSTYPGGDANSYGYQRGGNKYNNGSATSYGASFGTGDVIGVALDLDGGTLVFYKNGVSQGTAYSGLSGTFVFAGRGGISSTLEKWNFGQRAFAYSAPSGYKALCTTNLATPTIADGSAYFDAATYTGTGSNLSVPLGFEADLIWTKSRSASTVHVLQNSVSGITTKYLVLPNTDSEQDAGTGGVISTSSTGFVQGTGTAVNVNNSTYVSWAWDAGSSNTTIAAGSVASSTIYDQSQLWSNNFSSSNGFASGAEATKAFDGSTATEAYASANNGVLTMTFSPSLTGEIEMDIPNGGTFKNSSTNAVIGSHSGRTWTYTASNLPGIKIEQTGGRPNPTRVKLNGKILLDSNLTAPNVPRIATTARVNATAGFSVVTYSGDGFNGATIGHGLGVEPDFCIIKARNKTDDWRVYHSALGTGKILALNSSNAASNASNWQSINSTTLGLQNDAAINGSGYNYVAYFFAAVAGYSAFGSYTGNGSTDGPFVHLGFRARFILFKNTAGTENWRIMDTARNTFNVVDNILYPNLSNAEGSSAVGLDILSNGFKIKESGSELNDSGDEIVYAAFAENPFQANGGLAR